MISFTNGDPSSVPQAIAPRAGVPWEVPAAGDFDCVFKKFLGRLAVSSLFGSSQGIGSHSTSHGPGPTAIVRYFSVFLQIDFSGLLKALSASYRPNSLVIVFGRPLGNPTAIFRRFQAI